VNLFKSDKLKVH